MNLDPAVSSVVKGTPHVSDNDYDFYKREFVHLASYKAGQEGVGCSTKEEQTSFRVAHTVFRGYYRLAHGRSERFGGFVLIAPPDVLAWFRHLVSAFLDTRGVGSTATTLADFSRAEKQAKGSGLSGRVLILSGIPPNPGSPTSAWDLINVVQNVSAGEVILLSPFTPDSWQLSGTSTNKEFVVGSHFKVFDLYEFTRKK